MPLSSRLPTMVAMVLGLPALAQPVFTPANAIPAFGQYACTATNHDTQPSIPIDTNATSGVWDFSAADIADPWDRPPATILPASSTPFHAEFPEADVCRVDHHDWGELYTYHRNGPDTLKYLGEVVSFTGSGVADYTSVACRSFQFVYPAAIGSVHQEDVTDCQGNYNGLPQTWRRRILATGTFISSVLTVENAILVMDHLDVFNELFEPPLPLRATHYSWYRQGDALHPFARWYPTNDLNILYLDILTTAVGIEETGVAMRLNVYPNPTTDRITLQNRDGQALGEVRIHAADGRLVREVGMNATDMITLDVQDLPAGVYTIVMTTNGQRTATRFVKH